MKAKIVAILNAKMVTESDSLKVNRQAQGKMINSSKIRGYQLILIFFSFCAVSISNKQNNYRFFYT